MSYGELSTITCELRQCIPRSTTSTADLAVSPGLVKEDIHRNGFKGKAASIQRVPNGGHLVPQVKPDGVADAILATFGGLTGSTTNTKSRL